MAKTLISSLPFAGASLPFRHILYPLPSCRIAATRVRVSFNEIPPLHSFISVENLTSALSKAESLLYTLAEATAANADDAVPQKNGGWFGFISDEMELVLKVLKDGFSAVHLPYSYGFAITLPTVIVKAATFPLTKKQFGYVESTLAMQNLQPKIKAIQQRYAGNQWQLHRDQVSRNGGWRRSRIINCSRLQQSDSKSDLKSQLYVALEGVNRGIFGVASDKKSEIEGVAKLLESCNPTLHPALNLHKVGGCWKLLYTSLTILGSKRTKLGLRDFISLGDFLQIIDASKRKAVNIIKFNIRGFNLIDASLTIEASFNVASISRVDITYESSTIKPQQLMNMFNKNYNLLLAIFNPEGWLEITYVDDDIRIGRDDKSNIFILERLQDQISP